MSCRDRGFRVPIARALLALVVCVLAAWPARPTSAQPLPPSGPQQVAAFLGTWCAQGDPSKQTSIASNGPGNGVFLTLTNELGDTSPGNLQGSNQIVAPGWQFVVGTLSPDGSQINWSNGTMWARCPGNGGGWTPRWPRLGGTWFANGDRSRPCSIRQTQGSLALQNEAGQTANGNFTRRHDINTNWNGTVISGHVSRDGNRIDWSNGTWWVRDVVYAQ